jgi:hypothetical protein
MWTNNLNRSAISAGIIAENSSGAGLPLSASTLNSHFSSDVSGRNLAAPRTAVDARGRRCRRGSTSSLSRISQ